MGRRGNPLLESRSRRDLGRLYPQLYRALWLRRHDAVQFPQFPMTLRDRIGVDVGRKLPLEDAIAWAASHQVRFIDVQLDSGANALGTIDAARGAAIRAGCARHGIHLGLHTASSVNV